MQPKVNQPGVNFVPASDRPMARTYNMTVKDAMESAHVVIGTLPINSTESYVLFDSRATKSFIYARFATKHNLISTVLEHPLQVMLANSELYVVRRIYPRCELKVRKYIQLI